MRFRDLQRYPLSEIREHIIGGDRAITSDGEIVFWLSPRDSQASGGYSQAQSNESGEKRLCLAPRDSQAKHLEAQAQKSGKGENASCVTPRDSHEWCEVCGRAHLPPVHGFGEGI